MIGISRCEETVRETLILGLYRVLLYLLVYCACDVGLYHVVQLRQLQDAILEIFSIDLSIAKNMENNRNSELTQSQIDEDYQPIVPIFLEKYRIEKHSRTREMDNVNLERFTVMLRRIFHHNTELITT